MLFRKFFCSLGVGDCISISINMKDTINHFIDNTVLSNSSEICVVCSGKPVQNFSRISVQQLHGFQFSNH